MDLTTREDPETDALFDVSDAALALRFGRKVRAIIRAGGDPYETARLAFSYAERSLLATRHTVRRSLAAREQDAGTAVQERLDVLLVLLVTGRVRPADLAATSAEIVRAVLAIMRGATHE